MLELLDADAFRSYVRALLCERADLEGDTPLHESKVRRRGAVVGIEFLLLAPRGVRLSAIWSAAEDRLLCYGANGARWHDAALRGPDLAEFEAGPANRSRTASLWSAK
jgi:hypothetical protein